MSCFLKSDQLKLFGIKEFREVYDPENRACGISLARLSPRLLLLCAWNSSDIYLSPNEMARMSKSKIKGEIKASSRLNGGVNQVLIRSTQKGPDGHEGTAVLLAMLGTKMEGIWHCSSALKNLA